MSSPSAPRPAAAEPRRRDPEAVRGALLDAVTALLAEGQAISIGAVADRAGVSKGAAQHHFGTRAAMLEAVMDACLADFTAQLQAERAAGETDAARAYVRATFRGAPADGLVQWRAMLAALVVERAAARRWADWLDEDRRQDRPADSRDLILRLAADGLWLSDLLGLYRLSADDRTRLEADLLALQQAPIGQGAAR
ncbi:MAG: hypothetical protein RLY78_3083 [Pseudomonadota bacterium]|jgi:AcrR family transcriptional regulator